LAASWTGLPIPAARSSRDVKTNREGDPEPVKNFYFWQFFWLPRNV
jgi:hypothetical protein